MAGTVPLTEVAYVFVATPIGDMPKWKLDALRDFMENSFEIRATRG